MRDAMHSVVRAVARYLSITIRYGVKTAKHIVEILLFSDSPSF